MHRVIAQARKELTQFMRDRLALALALVLPTALMVLMSTALSLVPTDMPVAVRDFDNSPLSRRFVEAIGASLVFEVAGIPTDWSAERAFESGTVRAVVVIPEHFSRDLLRGKQASVQTLVDATDTNTATQVRGYVAQVAQSFSMQIQPPSGGVRVHTRLWYNPGRSSQKFFGPGALVFVLSIFPPLLAALAMSKENEQRTISQVYVSSISAAEYLLGKIGAYMIVAAGAWTCAVSAALLVFGLRFAGDPTPFLVASVLYLFTAVSFGVMIGAAVPTQAVAIQAVAVSAFLSSFLLSGFIFPVQNVPESLRWITYLVQARYFMEISRDAFLQGGGWPAMTSQVLAVAAIGAFYFLMGWKSMRRMQVKA